MTEMVVSAMCDFFILVELTAVTNLTIGYDFESRVPWTYITAYMQILLRIQSPFQSRSAAVIVPPFLLVSIRYIQHHHTHSEDDPTAQDSRYLYEVWAS